MASTLTSRQQQVFDLVRSEIARTGFPPTRMEIARALGFKSANAAEDHPKALARKGAINLTAGASRGIRLNTKPDAGTTGSPAPGHSHTHAASTPAHLLLPLPRRVTPGRPPLAAAPPHHTTEAA